MEELYLGCFMLLGGSAFKKWWSEKSPLSNHYKPILAFGETISHYEYKNIFVIFHFELTNEYFFYSNNSTAASISEQDINDFMYRIRYIHTHILTIDLYGSELDKTMYAEFIEKLLKNNK